MNKGNMCIVVLITMMFIVSCEFLGDNDANKGNATSGTSGTGKVALGQDGSGLSDVRNGVSLAQGGGHDNENMLNDETASGVGKQEKPVTKLTTDDMDKLKAFFEGTKLYQGILYFIYSKYSDSSSIISTYTGCDYYISGCFGDASSKSRSGALDKLAANKLEKEFEKLKEKLKAAATGYNLKTLTDAIGKYKEAMEKAKDAEAKIEKEDYDKKTKELEETKKKENVDNLKTVREIISVSKKTIELASVAYAEAFLSIVSNLSSDEFTEAVKEFTEAAREYANGNKGDKSIDAIVGAIAGMGSDKYKDTFDKAKKYAKYKEGQEGDNLFAAIEKLETTYKKAKPEKENK
ncbi:hypothetical protein [Borrelia turcica]|uniref:hypothetical protein n=1 Tax=Borrelia turcica TaxID=229155 RepID=UPI0018803979|nr:hypothetical protein [Borrelia turcica]